MFGRQEQWIILEVSSNFVLKVMSIITLNVNFIGGGLREWYTLHYHPIDSVRTFFYMA